MSATTRQCLKMPMNRDQRIRLRAQLHFCKLVMILGLTLGCNVRSKEQLQEISGIEQRVVSNPASINVDAGSGTPLDVAVINNYMELAEWLVDDHADVNAHDSQGETALHRAVVYDRPPDYKMIRFLLRKGADVNATRQYQETPLHQAASLGLKEVARILVKDGADVNAQAGRGETPLHMASCPVGYPEIVELLLLHGANIEARQNNGATALHQAVLAGNIHVVELLLTKGASPAATNQGGKTPLHYAAVFGRAEIAGLLLAHNAVVNALDADGHTPLWLALHAAAITASTSGAVHSGRETTSVAETLRHHGGAE
jgi:ankyrin repeat protein